MKKNLVIYESYYGTAKRTANILSLILSNSKVYDIKYAPEKIEGYDNLILVFAFHGYSTAQNIKKYLKEKKDNIKEKFITIIGVGLSKNDLQSYCKSIYEIIGKTSDITEFIQGELRVNILTKKDKEVLEQFLEKHNIKLMDMGVFKIEDACERAREYKDIINKPFIQLEETKLKKCIDKFIVEHNTCTLATGVGSLIRATPIEYVYMEECFYFLTEGGLKFYGILQNHNVSICIYENYTTMSNIKGLQVMGKANIIDTNSEEYANVMRYKKINIESMNSLNINMIKVIPSKFEFLNSNFKLNSLDIKQILEF